MIGKNAQSKKVKTIAHVPPRINQTSVPVTNAIRPPRVSLSPVLNNQKTERLIEHVPPWKLFYDSNTSNLSEFKPLTCSKERSNFLQSLGIEPKNFLHHTSNSESLHKTKTGCNKSSYSKPKFPALINSTNKCKQTSKCEQKMAEMTIPSPLTHFPNGTIIYKLFNKEYWKAKITQYNPKTSYYTVRYDTMTMMKKSSHTRK